MTLMPSIETRAIVCGITAVIAAFWVALTAMVFVFGKYWGEEPQGGPFKPTRIQAAVIILFIAGGWAVALIVNDFVDSRSTPIFPYLVYGGYIIGAIIGLGWSRRLI